MSFNSSENRKESLDRFEEMLRKETVYFFDNDTFQYLIQHYTDKGNIKKAILACNYALEQYPFSGDFLFEKAQLYERIGQFEEALALLENAEAMAPSDPEVRILRGLLYSHLGQMDAALEAMQDAMEVTSEKDEVYYQMGIIYESWEYYPEAIRHFQSAIEENPDHEEAHDELIRVLEYTDRVQEGIGYFEKKINDDPYSARSWFSYGVLQFRVTAYSKAYEAFEYATLIDNDYVEAYTNLGHACFQLGQYQNALEVYKEALELEETEELYLAMAACYESIGDFQNALNNYRNCVHTDPSNDWAWFRIGCLLADQEKWFEALHFLKKALNINDARYQYWLAFGDCEFNIGNLQSSEEAYEKACMVFPQDPEIYLKWAFVFFEQEEYSKAADVIASGIEELPENADLYYRMTVYLIYQGKFKEAFIYLENALILDYEKHTILFEFFTELETQKALFKVIDHYRK